MAWSGTLNPQDVANAFRAAVAKAADGNENLEAALKVKEDGNFDFDDINFDSDEDLDGDDDEDGATVTPGKDAK